MTRSVRLISLALVLAGLPPLSAARSAEALDTHVAALTGTIVDGAGLNGGVVVVSPNNMLSAADGLSPPLANILAHKVTTSLKQKGVQVRAAASRDQAHWMFYAFWKPGRDGLTLTFMTRRRQSPDTDRMVIRSRRASALGLDAGVLTPDSDSYARALVHQLAGGTGYQRLRTVHVGPVDPGDGVSNPAVSRFFQNWLLGGLRTSGIFKALDPKDLYDIPLDQIRTRAASGKAGLVGDMLNTDAEIRTRLAFGPQAVQVVSSLTARGAADAAFSATTEVPRSVLPAAIQKSVPQGGPAQPPQQQGGISLNGLVAELATTAGGGSVVYHKGQLIRFVLRLNRAAYIYLFDFDSKGQASLLYPQPDQAMRKVPADTPFILPDDGALGYEYVVGAPYGKDLVLLVASEAKLDVPLPLGGDWTTAEGARKRIRALGLKSGGGYAEAEVAVETRQ